MVDAIAPPNAWRSGTRMDTRRASRQRRYTARRHRAGEFAEEFTLAIGEARRDVDAGHEAQDATTASLQSGSAAISLARSP